jgi:hypothetical protein
VSTEYIDIRKKVYDILNDSDYHTDAASPSTATLRQSGHTINEQIKQLVMHAERLGNFALAKKGASSLSVVAGTSEYDLYTTWSDYRARLTLVRSDTSKPVPIYWPECGDYQAREWLRTAGYLFGMDLTWLSSRARAHDVLRQGRKIVFVLEPTVSMTIDAYYLPTIPQFANVAQSAPASETLADLGLEFLEAHWELIARLAANAIRPEIDEAVTQDMLLPQVRGSEAFTRAMKLARGGPRVRRFRSRWLRWRPLGG